eukprot:3841965-Pleurochrysis_carterae.AAC.2
MAQQQMTADLLPFSVFHVPDVSGRVGSNPSHEERALEYGTPGWSSASCFPFPSAAWLRRGRANAEPGPIYRLAHSYVYNRYTTLFCWRHLALTHESTPAWSSKKSRR